LNGDAREADQGSRVATVTLQVWALACEVGACLIIGEVEAGEAADGPSAMALLVLPMDGCSARNAPRRTVDC